jgi:hypothetical protein
MATQKFTDLTATTTPNTESVFAIAYSGSNFKLTITDLAANLPAVTATSLTSSGTLTTTSNATIGGDLTISGDDLFMATNTSGAALIADGTNFNPVVISGDISIGSTGTAAIGTGVIVNADVNASAALAFSKMENLTASRALVSDGSGDVSVSAVTSTEVGYLDGVTSNIQTQLDAKLANVVEDTTPQLGGDLDVNSNAIVGTSVAINASNGDLMITATEDGPVALRYDGNLKLSTKSDGVNITGELEADSLDIDGNADITGTLNTHTIPGGTGTFALTSDLGDYITASSTDTLTNKSGSNSQWTNDAGYITASSTDTLTNKSGNISQWTNDSSYLTGNQTITLSGDASGSGTTAITVTVADDSHNHIISNVDGLQTALDGKVPQTSTTGSAEIPAGTTLERDGTPSAGYLRFNSDETSFEGYDGSAWGSIGGGASAGGAIYENTNSINANYTLTTNTNGMSVAPVTIAGGVTVTVPSGARWVII